VAFGSLKLQKLTFASLVALCALGAVLALWHLALPSFGPLEYRYDAGPLEQGAFPLSVATTGKELHLHTTVRVGPVRPLLFSLAPDDCLKRLSINGSPVRIPNQLCYPGAARLWLRFPSGVSELDADISDNGVKGGLRLGVSIVDPVFLGFIGLGVLIVLLWAFSLAHASEEPRVAYATLLVVILAIAVRLPFILMPGYGYDAPLFAGWAASAEAYGVGPSYLHQTTDIMLPNYPPVILAILAQTGRVYRWLLDPAFDTVLPDFRAFDKMPGIAADAATAFLLFFIVRRSRGGLRPALFAGLAYALNPAVLFESAVWSQVDSLFTVWVVAALAAAVERWWVWAGVFAALGFLSKVQAFLLFPTLGVLGLLDRRALGRIVLGGIGATVLTLLPLASITAWKSVLDVYLHSAGFYPVLSMNADNLWVALFGMEKARWQDDTILLFGLASCRTIGLALFAVFAIGLPIVYRRVLRRGVSEWQRATMLLLVPAATAYAFFLFNTQMHERYLFPLMALGLPVCFISRAGRVVYVAATALFLLNLTFVLPWTAVDRAMFRDLPNLPAAIGACHLFLFGAFLRTMRRA
jgi:Gpi18-like mannosyltransferase